MHTYKNIVDLQCRYAIIGTNIFGFKSMIFLKISFFCINKSYIQNDHPLQFIHLTNYTYFSHLFFKSKSLIQTVVYIIHTLLWQFPHLISPWIFSILIKRPYIWFTLSQKAISITGKISIKGNTKEFPITNVNSSWSCVFVVFTPA